MTPPNALVVDIRSAWRPGMAYVIGVSIITKKNHSHHIKRVAKEVNFLSG